MADSSLRAVRTASTSKPCRSFRGPNTLYRALASFTATYLEHLAVEEGEALPTLWEHCSDQELFGIMTSFKASRSPLEILTSLIAQLPNLNPAEIAQLVSVGIDATDLPALAELLATTLQPVQLGALQQVPTTGGRQHAARPGLGCQDHVQWSWTDIAPAAQALVDACAGPCSSTSPLPRSSTAAQGLGPQLGGLC